MIGKWEADIENAEFTGAKTLHTDLVKLRHHLESGTFDGIAELLVKLGGSTGRAALVSHLCSGQTALSERQDSIAHALMTQGYGMGQAQTAALALIDRTVQRQATVIAYDSAFLVSGVVFVLVLPLVFFLKKGDAKAAAGGEH